MSFIGRLFASKKPRGSRVGNFLRQVAYNNTGGVLGANFDGRKYADLLINGSNLQDATDNSLVKW